MASGDTKQLLRTFKELLNDVLDSNKLAESLYGTVTSISPLTIKISDKISIKESMIIVPRHLTDYETKLTIHNATGGEIAGQTKVGCDDCSNVHELARLAVFETKITIHNALKSGDKVILLRNNGGKEYFIIDRVVS